MKLGVIKKLPHAAVALRWPSESRRHLVSRAKRTTGFFIQILKETFSCKRKKKKEKTGH